MNSFASHGIEHLSASSLNLWAAEPAVWAMERLLGLRSPVSALMARGKAVEEGIHGGLIDPQRALDACVETALGGFDREMALIPDDRRDGEREQIPGYVEHGLAELRQYGIPSGYQVRVEIRLDDVPVPIIGFIDWRFDQHGMVIDLKTSERHATLCAMSKRQRISCTRDSDVSMHKASAVSATSTSEASRNQHTQAPLRREYMHTSIFAT